VKNTNALLEKLEALRGSESSPEFSELTRRLGFEWNGMRLHEYYFEQFENAGVGDAHTLEEKLTAQFGSMDAWKKEFLRIGMMRGIGWALLVQDERTGVLLNHWVSDHEVGHLAGVRILLAMDVWEHAYLLDYLPAERQKYLDAFFENVNWGVVEKRFVK
jgi:Fe-Mn family superoxide dismutase